VLGDGDDVGVRDSHEPPSVVTKEVVQLLANQLEEGGAYYLPH
jgi:hypothetical protein